MSDTMATPGLLAPVPRRAQYRDYQQVGIERVREFYRNNHSQQTLGFVLEKSLLASVQATQHDPLGGFGLPQHIG